MIKRHKLRSSDKSGIIVQFAKRQRSGILSPEGGTFISPGRKPWGKVKIVTEPRAERAIVCFVILKRGILKVTVPLPPES